MAVYCGGGREGLLPPASFSSYRALAALREGEERRRKGHATLLPTLLACTGRAWRHSTPSTRCLCAYLTPNLYHLQAIAATISHTITDMIKWYIQKQRRRRDIRVRGSMASSTYHSLWAVAANAPGRLAGFEAWERRKAALGLTHNLSPRSIPPIVVHAGKALFPVACLSPAPPPHIPMPCLDGPPPPLPLGVHGELLLSSRHLVHANAGQWAMSRWAYSKFKFKR